ncbi:acyclic terpene utilization AtuA family protein [Pseudonocardia ailaonensis]|uniref:Acyclic terpene utilization AtuA family protein n=1 Tax=Pseudonocardia ailaonensis TaxID=367279 RepID=A0ABN2N5E7_9PSEU
MSPTRILTPTGMLGYGYPEADFRAVVESGVDAIVVDSGSTDPGPSMLGLGDTLVTEESYTRDLRPMLRAVHEHAIPLLIGSAGGAGTNAQVDGMVSLIDRIAAEEGISLRVAAVYADVPADVVRDRLDRVEPDPRGERPTVADVDSCTAIVAQMGAEPFTAVLDGPDPVDVIVAGRAYDPAPYAAFLERRGVAEGIAWHVGKILECGGACAEPKGGGVLATVRGDSFDLTPMGPGQRCTPLSVAAHTLYEKSRPDLLPGPAGLLDLRGCTYTALDERTVRVAGSVHVPSARRTVKLEGAAIVGHRCVFVGGVRDPILIGQLDEFLARVEEHAGVLHPELAAGEASVVFHVYGRDGTMGEWEPHPVPGHEVGILGEVLAATPALAKAICTSVRVGVLHLSYPGQKATAGNLALPLTPLDNPIGPACVFALYHVMDAEGLDLFPVVHRKVGA